MINFSWKNKTWPSLLLVLIFFALIVFSALSHSQQQSSANSLAARLSEVAGTTFYLVDNISNFSWNRSFALNREAATYYGPRIFFCRSGQATYLIFAGRNDRELSWRIFGRQAE